MQVLVLKHVPEEGPGTLGQFLQSRGVNVMALDLFNGDSVPSSPDRAAAIVVMGGPMSVYDEAAHPYLTAELRLLEDALRREVPVLGICLGAQLLARAAGAAVRKATPGEVGWSRVELTGEGVADPLFRSVDRQLDVLQWHQDTFDLPADGVLLARNEVCPHQALRVGPHAYGLQFHIEATPEMMQLWFAASERGREVLQTYEEVAPRVCRNARILYMNFLDAVITRSPA